MEFSITPDNMFAIKHVSLSLTREEVLELAAENFKDDFVHGAEYVMMEVRDEAEDNFTNWFLIPKSSELWHLNVTRDDEDGKDD
jgi:hypothetical protein